MNRLKFELIWRREHLPINYYYRHALQAYEVVIEQKPDRRFGVFITDERAALEGCESFFETEHEAFAAAIDKARWLKAYLKQDS
ncbi:MAG: hypothetical protein LKJ69_09210 [Lactobacillus sp.]|jgi:hypothetical protein|nr:hypothetical protein [Lactobacillus sp.]MCI2033545.1 hypothetical protein [Lactobacillus sp.]